MISGVIHPTTGKKERIRIDTVNTVCVTLIDTYLRFLRHDLCRQYLLKKIKQFGKSPSSKALQQVSPNPSSSSSTTPITPLVLEMVFSDNPENKS